MKVCPNCAKDSAEGSAECGFCGLVFAKWRDPASKPVSREVVSVSMNASIDPLLWGGAAVLAGALFLVRGPLRRAFFLLDGADLIIHEAGHPIFGTSAATPPTPAPRTCPWWGEASTTGPICWTPSACSPTTSASAGPSTSSAAR
ncbi:MAG: hypothetical protein A2V88_03060 [Elusimicrobia bacterium RBG_16_66_12]|nr:MAG: hypothetical protein A2V88_03060 [Elusimicrobia bacterium RBG_16_66_12]